MAAVVFGGAGSRWGGKGRRVSLVPRFEGFRVRVRRSSTEQGNYRPFVGRPRRQSLGIHARSILFPRPEGGGGGSSGI